MLLNFQVVQLTSLRSTNDMFCDRLRQGLKSQLQLGQMKLTKQFAHTLYSEALLSSEVPLVMEKDKEESQALVDLKPSGPRNEDTEETGDHLRGLGATFKYPGDAKKCVYRPTAGNHLS